MFTWTKIMYLIPIEGLKFMFAVNSCCVVYVNYEAVNERMWAEPSYQTESQRVVLLWDKKGNNYTWHW